MKTKSLVSTSAIFIQNTYSNIGYEKKGEEELLFLWKE